MCSVQKRVKIFTPRILLSYESWWPIRARDLLLQVVGIKYIYHNPPPQKKSEITLLINILKYVSFFTKMSPWPLVANRDQYNSKVGGPELKSGGHRSAVQC